MIMLFYKFSQVKLYVLLFFILCNFIYYIKIKLLDILFIIRYIEVKL